MCDHNKNDILDYYYNLDDQKKRIKIKKQINECEGCKSYLNLLVSTGENLDQIENSLPLENTFDLIEQKINEIPQVAPAAKKSSESIPVLKIAVTIIFVLLGLYFLQNQMEFLTFWEKIETSWLVKTFGKYSFIFILFFAIGSLITLAFAPILYMQSNKGKRVIFK